MTNVIKFPTALNMPKTSEEEALVLLQGLWEYDKHPSLETLLETVSSANAYIERDTTEKYAIVATVLALQYQSLHAHYVTKDV